MNTGHRPSWTQVLAGQGVLFGLLTVYAVGGWKSFAARVAPSWVGYGLIVVLCLAGGWWMSDAKPVLPRDDYVEAVVDLPAFAVIREEDVRTVRVLLPPERALKREDVVGGMTRVPVAHGRILTRDTIIEVPQDEGDWTVVKVSLASSVAARPGDRVAVIAIWSAEAATPRAASPTPDLPAIEALTTDAHLLGVDDDQAVVAVPKAVGEQVLRHAAAEGHRVMVVRNIAGDSASPVA
ncbi:MAG TPA: SAF domain-containing protein [Thermomicrobiales bacterium]|jgi:hypothetical protein